MNSKRNRAHHNKHHRRNGIYQETYVKRETINKERQPREIERGNCLIKSFGSTRSYEKLICRIVAESSDHSESQCSYKSGCAVTQEFAKQS